MLGFYFLSVTGHQAQFLDDIVQQGLMIDHFFGMYGRHVFLDRHYKRCGSIRFRVNLRCDLFKRRMVMADRFVGACDHNGIYLCPKF
jgi:hypothetical protein